MGSTWLRDGASPVPSDSFVTTLVGFSLGKKLLMLGLPKAAFSSCFFRDVIMGLVSDASPLASCPDLTHIDPG